MDPLSASLTFPCLFVLLAVMPVWLVQQCGKKKGAQPGAGDVTKSAIQPVKSVRNPAAPSNNPAAEKKNMSKMGEVKKEEKKDEEENDYEDLNGGGGEGGAPS